MLYGMFNLVFFTRFYRTAYRAGTSFLMALAGRGPAVSAGRTPPAGSSPAPRPPFALLIFDEPTSGLDPVSRDELLTLFRVIAADGAITHGMSSSPRAP